MGRGQSDNSSAVLYGTPPAGRQRIPEPPIKVQADLWTDGSNAYSFSIDDVSEFLGSRIDADLQALDKHSWGLHYVADDLLWFYRDKGNQNCEEMAAYIEERGIGYAVQISQVQAEDWLRLTKPDLAAKLLS